MSCTGLDHELLELSAELEGLPRVLQLVACLTGARLGYIEVGGMCCVHSDVGEDAGAISPHIVRRARVSGQVVATACAVADDRFGALDTVQQHAIQAVLCVPIAPVGGVLYLQGRDPFGADARDHALRVARRISECVLLRRADTDRRGLHQATRAFQRRHVLGALERTHWNITDAARELQVARSYVYRLIEVHQLRQFASSSEDTINL